MKRPLVSQYKAWPVLLVVAALSMAPPLSAGDNLYRYRNAEGILVIDHRVPPEYAAKGYDILSSSGQLLKRVPPQALESETEEQRKARKKLVLQREEDNFLLRSYSSIAEIEAARDRKLALLDREIEIIETNIKDTRQMRRDEERKAANQQRAGREVSQALLDVMSSLQEQEQDAVQMLELRRGEQQQAEQRFDAYIQRYRELTSTH